MSHLKNNKINGLIIKLFSKNWKLNISKEEKFLK